MPWQLIHNLKECAMENTSNPVVAEFFNYNRWANLHLIDACLALTPEQLASTAPGTYGNIYDTFVHIVRSEAGYNRRLTGIMLEPPFAWEAAPSLAEIRPYADQVSRSLVEVASQIKITDTLPRHWHEPEWASYPEHYRKVGLLIQVLNHGVEHRTNITTILAQHGLPTPELDGWGYMLSNPDRIGV
jgi:uncharacterized damage-inducible protein DinB